VKFTDSIKERLLTALAGGLITLAGLTGGLFLKEAYQPLLNAVLPAISKTSLALLCLLLLTICLVSVPWLIALLLKGEPVTKEMLDKYEFLPDRSLFRKKGTKELYCGSCMTEKIESPMGAFPAAPTEVWICVRKECGRRIRRLPEDG
jgi:hypothetical protein